MADLDYQVVEDAAKELYIRALCDLPPNVRKALKRAYKKETNLIDGSPAMLLEYILQGLGYGPWITMYDPHIDEEAMIRNGPAIFFIGTNHPEFETFVFPEHSIVIDPWGYIPDQEGVEVISIGRN